MFIASAPGLWDKINKVSKIVTRMLTLARGVTGRHTTGGRGHAGEVCGQFHQHFTSSFCAIIRSFAKKITKPNCNLRKALQSSYA